MNSKILTLTVIATLIILSAGCITNDPISDSEPEYISTDTDGDGWSDSTERACGTNPYLKDTDGDGWHKIGKKWQVRIKINGNAKYLGLFKNETDAAIAYNEVDIKYYGEYACLNKIEGDK